MDWIRENRQTCEFFAGFGLILTTLLPLKRNILISSFFVRNYSNLYLRKPDLKTFIQHPGVPQLLILSDLSCSLSPGLFSSHMQYLDRQAIRQTREFCFSQPCNNFMAELKVDGVRYDVLCNCSSFNPWISTPLLINLYDLSKINKINIKKEKLTMIAYGSLKYDGKMKRFQFQPQSLGTTLEQIDWTWRSILKSKMGIFFFQGIVIGMGISLCYHNSEKMVREIKQIIESVRNQKAQRK